MSGNWVTQLTKRDFALLIAYGFFAVMLVIFTLIIVARNIIQIIENLAN